MQVVVTLWNVCRAGVVSIPGRAKIIHCQWYAYSAGVNIHKLCRCIVLVLETRATATSFRGISARPWPDESRDRGPAFSWAGGGYSLRRPR